MLLSINNIREKKSYSVERKDNSVQITVLSFFSTLLPLNCTAVSQSESRNFFMYIINTVMTSQYRVTPEFFPTAKGKL